MKGILTLRKSAVIAAVCLTVLCLPGYSEPTPEQVKERTEMLINAVDNDDVERAKLCIKLGADVNATTYLIRDNRERSITTNNPRYDTYRYTVLTYAVEYKKNKDIIELLIKSGADVNAKAGINGKTALMFAAENGNKDVVELLIKSGADVNAKHYYGGTALMSAAENGNKDVVELLIKSGTEVNASNNGWTALMSAAEKGNKDVAELLIKSGADVNAKQDYGGTALISAAVYGHKDVVELLIKAGANLNVKDRNPMSALMWAASEERKDIAELLIKAGADSGEALIWAVIGRSNAVKVLIDAGADVNAKDSEGISVLDYAILNGKKYVEKLLRDAGAKE